MQAGSVMISRPSLKTRVHSSSFCPDLSLETWAQRSRSWSRDLGAKVWSWPRDLRAKILVLVSRPWCQIWSWSRDLKKGLDSNTAVRASVW